MSSQRSRRKRKHESTTTTVDTNVTVASDTLESKGSHLETSKYYLGGKDDQGKKYASLDELWKAKTQEIKNKAQPVSETTTAPASETSLSTTTTTATTAAATIAAAPSSEESKTEDKKEEQQPAIDEQKVVYKQGIDYWEKVDATVDGMLGGFAQVSPVDIEDTQFFIKSLNIPLNYALDCGAGIGRVAKLGLIPLFKQVDLVEQNPKFVQTAREQIQDPKMKEFYTCGLQDFTPTVGKYDCIWMQWVVGHLPESHLVALLKRCKAALTKNGVICLKENNAKCGFLFDDQDGSVTRSDYLFQLVFKAAGLTLVKSEQQTRFPKGLFKVAMYALR